MDFPHVLWIAADATSPPPLTCNRPSTGPHWAWWTRRRTGRIWRETGASNPAKWSGTQTPVARTPRLCRPTTRRKRSPWRPTRRRTGLPSFDRRSARTCVRILFLAHIGHLSEKNTNEWMKVRKKMSTRNLICFFFFLNYT